VVFLWLMGLPSSEPNARSFPVGGDVLHTRGARPPHLRARATAVVVTALLASTLLAPVASATPTTPRTPSAAQVRDARAAAAAAGAVLVRAQQQEDDATAQLDALDAAVEALVEAWNAARVASEAAAVDLGKARGTADAAAIAATSAQGDVDRLAAASYQVGADLSGGLGEWASVLDSAFREGGVAGLADRVVAVGQVAADRRHQIESASALRFAALQAQLQAESAATALAASESAAQQAFAAVQAAQTSQQTQVARLTAQRDAAARVLSSARAHASVLARTRAAALARAAAERRAAAARAAAEAARRAHERQIRGGRPPVDTGGGRSWPTGSSSTSVAQRYAAVAFAEAQLGKPYVAGGRGPDNYDCSGLTSAAYIHAGVPMIAYSQAQFAAYQKIPVTALQPGDLVFYAFDTSDWGTIHHVGMYVGGGRMVEAPHTGDVVKYQTIWLPGLMAYGTRP
jgi:cell wall-associated NlpC family hydrolase